MVLRYSYKWTTSMKNVWEGVIDHDLFKQENWWNWDNEEFEKWLTTKRFARDFANSIIRAIKFR